MSNGVITTAEINRSLEPKRIDQFYVKFLEMPDNDSNILGRQVTSIERPSLTLQQTEINHKGVPIYHHGNVLFNEISIVFIDDDCSLVNKVLYDQIVCRQMGRGKGEKGFTEARFSIQIECYSANGTPIESYRLKQAFFTSISHSQQIYSDSQGMNEITVGVRYTDLEYNFLDSKS